MKNPFKLRSGNSPLFKNIGSSPAKHGVVGEDGKKSYRGHSHKGMSLSLRLGLTKEPTKIEKDISAVASDIQSKAKNIKTGTEKITKKFTKDINKTKSKVEKRTQNIGDKIAADIKEVKNIDLPRQFITDVKKLFTRKKKK